MDDSNSQGRSTREALALMLRDGHLKQEQYDHAIRLIDEKERARGQGGRRKSTAGEA